MELLKKSIYLETLKRGLKIGVQLMGNFYVSE